MKRKRETREISGREYRLSLLPPLRAARLLTWLLSRYGRPLLGVVLEVLGGRLTLRGLLALDTSTESGRAFVDGHLLPAIEALAPDDLDRLTVGLLDGVLETRDEHEGDWTEVEDIDATVADVWALFALLGWALLVNFLPTTAAGITSDTSGDPTAEPSTAGR